MKVFCGRSNEMGEIGRLRDLFLPWTTFIHPLIASKSNVGWSNISETGTQSYGSILDSDGAQNSEITWDVVLGAGTWSITVLHIKNTNRGIYSVQLDGVEKGTIDGYAASATYNVLSPITGIIVPTAAKIELKLKMETKNGSSSAYTGSIGGIMRKRT